MIILDPEREGCHVWRINASNKENCVSYIKGSPREVVNILLPYITTNVDARNQYGNRYRTLVLTDMVYIDQSPLLYEYKDIFDSLGLYLSIVPAKSSRITFGNGNELI